MKNKQIAVLVILSFVVGMCLLVFALQRRDSSSAVIQRISAAEDPQCAHLSIFRSCQLMGIPVEMERLMKMMPPKPKGHSFEQIAQVMKELGVTSVGYRDNWETLTQVQFPCIAHLKMPENSPAHYVVISGTESEKGYVHIFDGNGRRTRASREIFESLWSGATLHLQRDDDRNSANENVRLDYLLLDKGVIPAVGKPAEFAFSFHNVGKDDLIIQDVKVDCKCLRSEKPETPIPPGGTGVVKLFYKVEPRGGPFLQTALVTTSDKKLSQVAIVACGYSGTEVSITPDRLTLSNLLVEQDCTAQCYMKYTGEWDDLEVGVVSSKLKNAELITYAWRDIDDQYITSRKESSRDNLSSINSHESFRMLDLVFRPTGSLFDKVTGELQVQTNISGYEEFVVPVRGQILSPVKACPGTVLFQNVSPDTDVNKTVTLVSRNDNAFKVTKVYVEGNASAYNEIQFTKGKFANEVPIAFTLSGERAMLLDGKEVVVNLEMENSGQRVALPLKIAARKTRGLPRK